VVLVVALFDFWDIFFDRWLLHSDSLFTPKYWLNRQHGRFGSVFLNPNMLGAFTVLVFPATFIWAQNESNWWRRFYAWGGLLALVFCLVETQSRGPMLALAIALMMLTVGPCGGVSRTRRIGFLGALVVVFALFMPGFYDHAIQRFAEAELDKEMTTEDGRTRETVWGYARLMIEDHPLAGIGFGEKQFVKAIDALGFRDKYGEEPLDNPHNSYLQMAVYAGIPALAAFLLANLALVWRAAWVSWRNADDRTTQSVFGSVVGIAGFLAVIYPDMHMFTPAVSPVYWVFFGLLLSLTTTISQPAPAVKRYENSRSYFGDVGQRLAGQSASLPPQYHRDRPRAAAAGADRSREGRTATPDGAALRRGAHAQQAPVQPGPVAGPLGVRGEDGRRELLPRRGTGRVLATGADARRYER
jgi:O-antigen ligase